MKNNITTLATLATQHDAAVLMDRDGDIALQSRLYKDGIQQVRLTPDPCFFFPRAQWEEMDAAVAAKNIC